MTAEQARDTLPPVNVRFGNQVYPGCAVRGRQNDVATVYVPDLQHLEARFTWETIARAATTGSILQA
jgi:hypothetical protein